MKERKVLLECRNINKTFGSNHVLTDINLKIQEGEVHALLGQNGAGKSTLVKIITGVYAKDSGDILMAGRPVRLSSPRDAKKEGISIIHQDQQLVSLFDVTRNAFLGFEITAGGRMDYRKMKQQTEEKLRLIQADFTADRQVSTLSVGQREQVAIVSALLRNPRLLILDEPTASLSRKEIEKLFEIIARLKKEGVTIIYISHQLDEVFRITDTITVLRDSRVQSTFANGELEHRDVVSMMIGRELQDFYPKEKAATGEVILEVEDLHSGKLVNGVTFKLRRGEILGMAGLVGAGRTEAMLALYGAEKIQKGKIKVGGREYTPRSPEASCKEGIAFIPEDRRNEGIIAQMDIGENLSLTATRLWARHGIIERKLEERHCRKIIDSLEISCTGRKQLLGELSGGNQQKIVIGRWMVGDFRIFIFDQPTTGVDIGAKTEIYKQMIRLAQKGCGIIFVSSENEELIGICDRIAVMAKGRIVKELDAQKATEHEILFWAASQEAASAGKGGANIG